MRLAKAAAGAAVLAGVLSGAGSAMAAPSPAMPAGGKLEVYATPIGNSPRSTILFTGAIGDSGTALTIDANGKTDANGNFVKITLHLGTFEVNTTALNAKANKLQPTFYPATCSAFGSAVDPVTLFNGTGLYKGISGTVNIDETFAFLLPRYPSGPHKGQCNESNSAQPTAQYGSITGSGIVHFS